MLLFSFFFTYLPFNSSPYFLKKEKMKGETYLCWASSYVDGWRVINSCLETSIRQAFPTPLRQLELEILKIL